MKAVDRSLSSYVECCIADANLRVKLNLEIIPRLSAAVIEGFKAVPRRGLEVGGLLLGTIENECVIVDEFVPVDSEHQLGPSYVLSEKDKSSLSTEIKRVEAEQDGPRVIGLYRSHTRPEFAPSAEDQALMASQCPGSESLFLLIQAAPAGPVMGAWFAAGRGLWDRPAEFPFRGRELARPAQVAAEPLPLAVPEAPASPESPRPPEVMHFRMAKLLQAASARESEMWPQQAPPQRSTWLTPLIILVISGVAGYGIAAWLSTRARHAAAVHAPADRPMALRVTLDHGFLHLRWDRESPLVRKASGGVVWIEDGGQQRRVDLKASDLTDGKLQYWPSSSDVRFKLELLDIPEGHESVRAAGLPVLNNPDDKIAPPPARVIFEPQKTTTRRGGKFTAAKPLRAELPPDPAPARQGEVLVNVRVEIDSSGKVSRAEVISRSSPSSRELESIALRSARQWTFTPARSGERRVSTRGVLRYSFGNPVLADARSQRPAVKYVQKP